jgi:hypothetical protein
VPVYVPATALTKPGTIGAQLGAAVDASVSRYLKRRLPPGVFDGAPGRATEPARSL